MSVSSLFLVSRVSAAAWTSLQTVPFFGFFHPMQRCLCECWSMPGHTYILSFSPSCSKPLIPTQHWQNKRHFTDQPWICPTAHPPVLPTQPVQSATGPTASPALLWVPALVALLPPVLCGFLGLGLFNRVWDFSTST